MRNWFFLVLIVSGVALIYYFHPQQHLKKESPPVKASVDTIPTDTIVEATTLVSDVIPDTPAFSKEYITGRFDPWNHPAFVAVDKEYAYRDGMLLRREVLDAFRQMATAAKADGIHLVIRSATRNFNTQKYIWEAKWTGKRLIESGENLAQTTPDPTERARKILLFSSMPGTSRHHWGTDLDINKLSNYYYNEGVGKRIYEWMKANAAKYGFCQVYSTKGADRPYGYEEERWHWSYIPTASLILKDAQHLLNDNEIHGFLGADTAPALHVVDRYVLGLNPACLE